MKSWYVMEPEQLAEHYVQSKGGGDYLPTTATALVADVEAHLRRSGLDHRVPESATIAAEAFNIAQQVRDQQSAEDFQTSVREGYGDQREIDQAAMQHADGLALAKRINQMSVREFGAERERLGIAKTTFDHLAGL